MINRASSAKTYDIDQEEDIVSFLESSLWEGTIRNLFKESLTGIKYALLHDPALSTEKRIGYILYRQKMMEAFQTLYKRHNLQLPEWLEN